MYSKLLGSETDENLLIRLRQSVEILGGKMAEIEYLIGGSQEIIVYEITLPAGKLFAESETYIGLTLLGHQEQVELLYARVKNQQ
jgi:hypothetical protein